ncbi:MAG: hypothetical protein NDP13_01255 [Crenarchaeota archaeon]|nr:hypothetical protein [Thermoproteota archaeon]
MMYQYEIRSVGNLLADAFCSLGLFKLMLMVDPLIKVECNLGHYEILRIKSRRKPQDFEEEILRNLKDLVKSEFIRQQLEFEVNTGKTKNGRGPTKPAFEVLEDDLLRNMSSFSFSAFKPIEKKHKGTKKKERGGTMKTFYLSVLPVYGSGLEAYDDETKNVPAMATPEVIVSYMIGLAYYTVCFEENGSRLHLASIKRKSSKRESRKKAQSRLHLALIPPLGKRVDERYLLTINRAIALYFTEEGRMYINGLKKLPKLTLPLAVLAKLDLATIELLHEPYPPEILVFNVERAGKEKKAETSRLYERYNTTAILRFFLSLGEWMHHVKEYVLSLIKVRGYEKVQGTELSSLIDSILLKLTLAIINSDADLLNGALFETLRLKDRVEKKLSTYVNKIYMLNYKATSAMVKSLLRIS